MVLLDIYVLANSADPDHTAPRGVVTSGSSLFAIPFPCLNLRKITAKFSGIRKFRNFTVIQIPLHWHCLFQLYSLGTVQALL